MSDASDLYLRLTNFLEQQRYWLERIVARDRAAYRPGRESVDPERRGRRTTLSNLSGPPVLSATKNEEQRT